MNDPAISIKGLLLKIMLADSINFVVIERRNVTASNRRTVGRSPEHESYGRGFQRERIPFGAHPICTRVAMGLLGAAGTLP